MSKTPNSGFRILQTHDHVLYGGNRRSPIIVIPATRPDR